MASQGVSSKKVAILKCDDVLDKFRGEYGNYPEMISDSFSKIDAGLQFDTYDIRKGDYPERPADYRFFIISGSKASIYEPLPWIPPLLEYILYLERERVPVFGICFGHQAIASAKGCKVEKSPLGWGVGVAENYLKSDYNSFSANHDNLKLLVSHQDQVVNLSRDAIVFASSDFCPNFAVCWGDTMISVQGHPEWGAAYAATLLNDRRDRIPADVINAGIDSFLLPLDNSDFLQGVLSFVENSYHKA